MEWGGRREEGSGWGTHVYLWRIHFDIWQNQYNIVKFKNKIKFKKINKIKIKILCTKKKIDLLHKNFISGSVSKNSSALVLRATIIKSHELSSLNKRNLFTILETRNPRSRY